MIINKDILIPLFVAFAISVALSPFVIPFLQRLKVGQTEREEGVKSHLKKAGTPTMGGLIILISTAVTSLLFLGRYPRIIPVLFLILGFGIIGFLDDYLKVVMRRSDGLYPKQKMLGQLIVTSIFVIYVWFMDQSCLDILIPFSGGKVLNAGWVRIASAVIAFPAIIGTVNGVNFTDGLDGLATGVTTMVAVFFTVASMVLGGGIEPLTAAVTGALLGFLLFNVYPAKVFMGDTGSLNFRLLDDDHLAMWIGDVSDKGVPAALFMMAINIVINNRASMGGTPAEIMAFVNNNICEHNEANLFVTIWLGILEISTGRLTFVNAGHEEPALYRKGGSFELYKTKHNVAVGVFPDIEYTNYDIHLGRGDKLFVYTDGVPEATDMFDKLYTTGRMLEALNKYRDGSPQEILEGINKSVKEFVGDRPQFDDLTMLGSRSIKLLNCQLSSTMFGRQ